MSTRKQESNEVLFMASSHSFTLLLKKDISKCNNMILKIFSLQRLSLGIPMKIEMIINSKRALDCGKRGKAGASLLLFSLPFVPRALFPLPSLPTTQVSWSINDGEFALLQTLSRLIPSSLIRQMLATSFGVEF